MLESAVWDGAELLNTMLSDLSSLYPTFEGEVVLFSDQSEEQT
jgi:hypothetical protein